MFKKILVPVDGSEGSWRALAQAVAIGEKFESEIQVVNVIQPYNNAALLAVPLDHGTVKQGNSELEKIGDKVLEMAIPTKWFTPLKLAILLNASSLSPKKKNAMQSFLVAVACPVLQNSSWVA